MAVKTREVPNEVAAVLSRSKVDGNRILLPPINLDRKLYLKVNEVLQNLGGKWVRKEKAHVFTDETAESLAAKVDGVLTTGQFVHLGDTGFFPTPEWLVDQMVEYAKIAPGQKCLEPSAGTGNIAVALCRAAGRENVVCIEVLKANAAKLRARFGDYAPEIVVGDFLAIEKPASRFAMFDRVVMNPPFAGQADLAHVGHAWMFLRPGGILVSVMSAGVTFRDNLKSRGFRENLDKYGFLRANPAGTFTAAGTDVQTVTVVLNKPGE